MQHNCTDLSSRCFFFVEKIPAKTESNNNKTLMEKSRTFNNALDRASSAHFEIYLLNWSSFYATSTCNIYYGFFFASPSLIIASALIYLFPFLRFAAVGCWWLLLLLVLQFIFKRQLIWWRVELIKNGSDIN